MKDLSVALVFLTNNNTYKLFSCGNNNYNKCRGGFYMNKEQLWEIFTVTGKIDDYIIYSLKER